MKAFEQHWQSRLTAHRDKQLMRQRPLRHSAQAVKQSVNQQNYLAFNSNDYLGLANHPEVILAFQQAANDFGVGSGSAHLINGHTTLHHQLEEALAEFTGYDRALLFSTGYMANLAMVSALTQSGDCLLQDRHNHASLLDAAKISAARSYRFAHNDLTDLQHKLTQHQDKNQLIITEGVFSMDGDCAPLTQLAPLAQKHQALLMLDDAHGFGVMGPQGRGSVAAHRLDAATVPVMMATLGKAFGCFGAFIAGSQTIIENCLQFARSAIFTTALPPAVAAAALKSLAIIKEQPERLARLHENIQSFRQLAIQLPQQPLPSTSPIQPFIIGSAAKTMAVADDLAEKGFLVGAIRPPSVANGSARLRITLSAEHSRAQLAEFVEVLADTLPSPDSNPEEN